LSTSCIIAGWRGFSLITGLLLLIPTLILGTLGDTLFFFLAFLCFYGVAGYSGRNKAMDFYTKIITEMQAKIK
jgi:hypothetical protein